MLALADSFSFVPFRNQVLDHALSGPEGSDNCEKFIEALGLKTLFAAFVSCLRSRSRSRSRCVLFVRDRTRADSSLPFFRFLRLRWERFVLLLASPSFSLPPRPVLTSLSPPPFRRIGIQKDQTLFGRHRAYPRSPRLPLHQPSFGNSSSDSPARQVCRGQLREG